MCCGGKTCLLVASVLVLGIAYYVYRPLPDILANGDEPWQIRKNLALIKFAGDLAWLTSKLGFDKNSWHRYLMGLKVQGKSYEGMKVTDTEMKGVPVRIYHPDGLTSPSPAVVFYHGGGWIWGSIETHDCVTSALAKLVPAVVISVEYRLAPEHPYPIPLKDCLDATVEFMQTAGKYGVDPNRIAIAGDSAGGNLAAAVALKLRDFQGLSAQPKIQMLIYPVLQGFDMQLPSQVQNANKLYGSPRGLATAILSYMGLQPVPEELIQAMVENRHTSKQLKDRYRHIVALDLLPDRFRGDYKMADIDGDKSIEEQLSSRLLDPYFLPFMAEDLSKLPQAYIMTCEFDTLRDEAVLYARRLEKAGVDVTWVHYDDGFHTIMNFVCPPTTLNLGLKVQKDMVEYLQKNL